MSAPSIANTASTPLCPLMANCCVKFVAPLTSVMVPAASRSSVLKSRPLSGSSLTDWLDSFSPPVVSVAFAVALGLAFGATGAGACGSEAIVSVFWSETMRTTEAWPTFATDGAVGGRSGSCTMKLYRPGSTPATVKRPSTPVNAV